MVKIQVCGCYYDDNKGNYYYIRIITIICNISNYSLYNVNSVFTYICGKD